MFKVTLKNIFAAIFIGLLLSSCNSKKENFDMDFSKIKLPKKSIVKNSNQENISSNETKREIIKNKLIKYIDKSEILNSVAIGKEDPFSRGDKGRKEVNALNSLKITGFLNTDDNNKYVFVIYKNNKGTLAKGELGGVDTNLLPIGARVIDINDNTMELTINFENKNYVFEMKKF